LAAVPTSTLASAYYYQQQMNLLNYQLKISNEQLSSQISSLNGQINQLQSQVNQLTTSLASSNSQISTLNGEITYLSAQISQLQSQVNQLSSQLGSANSQIASLSTQITALNNQLSNLNQTLSIRILELKQALSEGLAVNQPGATNFTSQGFRINVENTGSVSVNITSIVIMNISPTGSSQCSGSNSCILYLAQSGTGFNQGLVQVAENNHDIIVSGISINDGSGYKVILASARGRDYVFFYPWPIQAPSNSTTFIQTNVGPLMIFLDFNSFNFTMTSQTQSHPAWVLPDKTLTGNPGFILWVKVVNQATSPVTIAVQSGLLLQQYTGSNAGTAALFIVNSNSVCPFLPTRPSCTGVTAYTLSRDNPSSRNLIRTKPTSHPQILRFHRRRNCWSRNHPERDLLGIHRSVLYYQREPSRRDRFIRHRERLRLLS